MVKRIPPFLVSILVVVSTLFNACKHGNRNGLLNANPLSPYTDSITFSKDEDVSAERRNGIKIKYFAIDEDVSYGLKFQNKLQDFIELAHKNDIVTNQAIYFTFYKTSADLDKDGKYSKQELITKHLNDKFAEFEYLGGKVYNVEYYKNGTYFTPDNSEE